MPTITPRDEQDTEVAAPAAGGVRSGIRDAVRIYQKELARANALAVHAHCDMLVEGAGDVAGVFWFLPGSNTYHRAYAEWGDPIVIPEGVSLLWVRCEGIDCMAKVPAGATKVYVSPFGVVFGDD